jgi:23S rRNA (guanosine2251-2'-O)-methyltransferase
MKRIVAGPRAVIEALASSAAAIAVVYLEEGGERGALREVAEAARRKQVRTEERTRSELDALAGEVRHQGVIAIGGDYQYVELETLLAEAATPALLVALDEITDPHNFGAIIRSAVAFGADGVITLRERSAPVTPVVVRASAGATERTRIARVTNLTRSLRMLRDQGLQIAGLAVEGSIPLADLPPAPGGRVVVIGSEGRGLRRLVREACDVLVSIPLPGPIASLNASVAAGIALYTAASNRRSGHGQG